MKNVAAQSTLVEDLLSQLGVAYTSGYVRRKVGSMVFPTLFGVKKVLEEYGVDSEGYLLSDRSEIGKLTPPYLAKTVGGVIVVTAVTPGSVSYVSNGVPEQMERGEFDNVWTGEVMLAYPGADACEPDYGFHSRIDFFNRSKRWVMLACWIAVAAYFFISGGLWRSWSTVEIVVVDLIGLLLSAMLVGKSANIHTAAADRVCGILQEGGCDKVLSLKASKFFGLFGWSEVGLAYFSVSLLALLLFPSILPELAVVNLMCLPFTVWSIWYQRFRAKHWCTLCVSVQCTLWLLFAGYCGGGWLGQGWPLRWGTLVILGLVYLGVMLGINALMPLIERNDETKA